MGIGRSVARCVATLMVCVVAALSSRAEAQSSRTIKIIVPSTAGGGADVLVRHIIGVDPGRRGVAPG